MDCSDRKNRISSAWHIWPLLLVYCDYLVGFHVKQIEILESGRFLKVYSNFRTLNLFFYAGLGKRELLGLAKYLEIDPMDQKLICYLCVLMNSLALFKMRCDWDLESEFFHMKLYYDAGMIWYDNESNSFCKSFLHLRLKSLNVFGCPELWPLLVFSTSLLEQLPFLCLNNCASPKFKKRQVSLLLELYYLNFSYHNQFIYWVFPPVSVMWHTMFFTADQIPTFSKLFKSQYYVSD